MQFVLKIQAAYAEMLREILEQMEAAFTEVPMGDHEEVISFNIQCDPEKMHILEKRFPIEGFANIGISSP